VDTTTPQAAERRDEDWLRSRCGREEERHRHRRWIRSWETPPPPDMLVGVAATTVRSAFGISSHHQICPQELLTLLDLPRDNSLPLNPPVVTTGKAAHSYEEGGGE
jgi:hypothetical protein